MWIKLLVGGLLIAFCVLLGYLASGKYRARAKFFAQFEMFNERYLSELAYQRKPLTEFLAAYEYTGTFQRVVGQCRGRKPPEFAESWLSREERGECADYFSMLGAGDSVSQSGYFATKKPYLAGKKGESAREARERTALYLKLGLLAGLAFVILIV